MPSKAPVKFILTPVVPKEGEIELWEPIPGYEGYYSCSSFGSIKSHDRIVTYTNGRLKKMTGRVLKPSRDKDGYQKVIFSISGVHKHFRINRIVALCFYGDSDLVTNHKDGNKHNNYYKNIEYCTQKENVGHYLKNGLKSNFYGGKPGVPVKLTNVFTREEFRYSTVKECATHYSADTTVIYHHLKTKETLFRKKYLIEYA